MLKYVGVILSGDGRQQCAHDDNNIERLVRNILNHPTFRTTVNQILHNTNSNIGIFTGESVDEVRSRFPSPATELS